MRRVCWPWCACRKAKRELRDQIAEINWVEVKGGWIPIREEARRAHLTRELEAL